jgi:hypothetical protein
MVSMVLRTRSRGWIDSGLQEKGVHRHFAFCVDQTRVMQNRHGKTPKILIMLIVSITTGLVVASVILVLIIWYRQKQPPAHRGHVVGDSSSGTLSNFTIQLYHPTWSLYGTFFPCLMFCFIM